MTITERTWAAASITTAAVFLLGVPVIAGFFGNLVALIAFVLTGSTFGAVFYRALTGPQQRPEPAAPKNAIQDHLDWKRQRNREAIREWNQEWDRLAKCPPGVIADPFVGAGATLIAARNLGRRVIGVEIEERYCETTVKRLAQGAFDFGDWEDVS